MSRFPVRSIPARSLPLGGMRAAARGACAAASAFAQDAAVERGRYLVTTVMACGNCHTPKDADGRPVAGKELSGGGIGFEIPPFVGPRPTSRPTSETGIGDWTDAEIRAPSPTASARSWPARRPAAGRADGGELLQGDPARRPRRDRRLPAHGAGGAQRRRGAGLPRARPARAFATADRGFADGRSAKRPRRPAAPTSRRSATASNATRRKASAARCSSTPRSAPAAAPFLPSFVKGLPASWSVLVSRNLTVGPRARPGRLERRRDQARDHAGRRPRRPAHAAADAVRLVCRHPPRRPRRDRRLPALAAAVTR